MKRKILHLGLGVLALTVLVLMAAPVVVRWLANKQIEMTADEMVAGIRLAREEAARRGAPVVFEFERTGNWTVHAGPQLLARSSLPPGSVGIWAEDVWQVTFGAHGRRLDDQAREDVVIEVWSVRDSCVENGGPIRCRKIVVDPASMITALM